MVVDYWKVNDMTKKDHYMIANGEVELDKLKSKRLFTQFDIRAGYNNIIIEEKDRFKAAFKTPIRTYIPQVMPFGLCNAPSLFQCATDQDFRPIKQKYPKNFAHYMDDMVIRTGDSPKEVKKHRKIMCEVLDLFRQHSYFLKLKKCVFETKEITFLRYKIGHGIAKVESTKMDGLQNWP